MSTAQDNVSDEFGELKRDVETSGSGFLRVRDEDRDIDIEELEVRDEDSNQTSLDQEHYDQLGRDGRDSETSSLEQISRQQFSSVEEHNLPTKHQIIRHDANNHLNIIHSMLEIVNLKDIADEEDQRYFESLREDVEEAIDAVEEGDSELSDENPYDTVEELFNYLPNLLEEESSGEIGEYLEKARDRSKELTKLFEYVESFERLAEGEDPVYTSSYDDVISTLERADIEVVDKEAKDKLYVPAIAELNRTMTKNNNEHATGEMDVTVSMDYEGDEEYVVFGYESQGVESEIPSEEEMLSLDASSEGGLGLGMVNYVVNSVDGEIQELGETEEGNFELQYRVPVKENHAKVDDQVPGNITQAYSDD